VFFSPKTQWQEAAVMATFDFDAFTSNMKAKLAGTTSQAPARTLHFEYAGDVADPLTAVGIRHVRAAAREYAWERAAACKSLLVLETHRVAGFLMPGHCSMPDAWTEPDAAHRARPGARDAVDVIERAHKVGLLREGWTREALSKRVHSNPTKAHRLVMFVEALRGAAAAERVVDALQTAHFAEGLALNDAALLDAAAVAGGASKFVVRRFLQTQELEREVAAQADAVAGLGVALPALFVDGVLVVEGLHTSKDAVLAALRACEAPTGARAFPPPARKKHEQVPPP